MFLSAAELLAAGPEVLRSRTLSARPESFRLAAQKGEKLRLRLFDDVDLTAVAEKVESDPLNGFVWRGRIEADEGLAVFVVDDDCIVGTVMVSASVYRVRCLGSGLHAIDEMTVSTSEGVDYVLPPLSAGSAAASDPYLELGSVTFDTLAAASAPTEIDLLVFYTRRSVKRLARQAGTSSRSSKRAMVAQIRLAVAVANASLENSDVDIRLRLVKARQVGFRASGTSGWDLSRIYDPDDGVLDRVHQWRDRFGADVVTAVLDDFEPDRAGLGYLVTPRHDDAASLMFNVVRYDRLWWITLAHEVGHNLGLAHDRDNDITTAGGRAFSFSRGFRDRRAGFHTVMSYSRGCPECRWAIPHYSNPRVDWSGAPSGSEQLDKGCGDGVTTGPKCGRRTGSNRADNARSLNETREFYASVRACRIDCVPGE